MVQLALFVVSCYAVTFAVGAFFSLLEYPPAGWKEHSVAGLLLAAVCGTAMAIVGSILGIPW